jgi:hypothetical protein
MKKIKAYGLFTSVILALSACNNSFQVEKNTLSNQEYQSDFSDLEKEYKAFSTKALTESYILRKLNKWLGIAPDGPADGKNLLKELIFAQNKGNADYPLADVLSANPPLYPLIKTNPDVAARYAIGGSFAQFLDSIDPAPEPEPEPIGEFRVNTHIPNNQQNPAVARDSAGDFVIAWDSNNQDGSAHGIYAQKYNRAGIPQGSEFRVNTYTSDSQRYPSVAMDDDGDFVIIWQSGYYDQGGGSHFPFPGYYEDPPPGQDGSDYGVYGQRYNSTGVAQGSEFRVNTFTEYHQFHPAVAMDSDGDFVVTWQGGDSYGQTQDGNRGGIYAQRYHNNGGISGSEFLVNTYTTQNQAYPSVAMDDTGNFLITWESFGQDGFGYGIFAQKFNTGGVKTGTEFQVNNFTISYQLKPDVAMDSDGDFVVTWYSYESAGDKRGIYARRYSSNGIPAPEGEFRANTSNAGNRVHPDVAMDNDGDFVITWQSNNDPLDTSYYSVQGKRYNSLGVAPAPEFLINTYTTSYQHYSSVAMDSDGDFVVSWISVPQDGSVAGIYAQMFNKAGEKR